MTSCQFNATLNGVGDFVVLSATAGHVAPESANVTDGKTYVYYAQSVDPITLLPDGLFWEAGSGSYTISTHTLKRAVITANSNGDLLPVDFPLPPIVDVYSSPSNTLELPFPSGTTMLFQQSAAPAGWTKQTTHNDKALRVVSGAASFGGTNAFSTVMAQTVVGNTTISTATMPSHQHPAFPVSDGSGGALLPTPAGGFAQTNTTGFTGGGGPHNHPITMAIQYVDVIICAKN